MGIVANLAVRVSANAADFEKTINGLSGQASKMGAKMQSVGGSLTAGLTLPIVGLGVAATKAGIDFEKVMNQITGVLQPTTVQMDQLRTKAIEMGAQTVFSAEDAATAMLEFSKAGFDVTQTMSGIDKVLQLAAASGLSMGDAAEMSARTLAMFGLETTDLAHVNDVLAKAVNSTTLEITDLQTAFRYIGPLAQAVGMSIEQASAAIGIMRDNGVAAETAGRTLREGFDRLLNPTKAVKDVIDQLSLTLYDANGKLLPFDQVIAALEPHANNAGAMLKMFGNAAGPGMVALVSEGSAKLNELTGQLQNSGGAAQKMADAMMTGLPGAFEQMKGSIETAMISISAALAPVLIPMLQFVAQLADIVTNTLVPAFAALPGPVQTAIVVFAGLVAAIGPILAVIGTMTVGLTGLVTLFPSIATAGAVVVTLFTTTLPAAFGTAIAFLGPQGLIAIAVLALGAIWYKWGDQITEIVKKVFTAVKTWLVDKFTDIVNSVKTKIDAVTGFFKNMYQAVVGGSYVPDMIKGIQSEFVKLGSVMVGPTEAAANAVMGIFSNLTNKVTASFSNMVTNLASKMGGTLGKFLGGPLGEIAGNLLGKGIGWVGGKLKDAFGPSDAYEAREMQGEWQRSIGNTGVERIQGAYNAGTISGDLLDRVFNPRGTEDWQSAVTEVDQAMAGSGYASGSGMADGSGGGGGYGGGDISITIQQVVTSDPEDFIRRLPDAVRQNRYSIHTELTDLLVRPLLA